MTQEQINELRRLAQAATPGPWAAAISSNMVNGVCATFETICETGKNIDDALYIAAANPAAIIALIQQRDELLAALNSAASVSHSGGLCGYAEDDALRLVRVITLPYWDKSASDDKHREAIAKAEAQS